MFAIWTEESGILPETFDRRGQAAAWAHANLVRGAGNSEHIDEVKLYADHIPGVRIVSLLIVRRDFCDCREGNCSDCVGIIEHTIGDLLDQEFTNPDSGERPTIIGDGALTYVHEICVCACHQPKLDRHAELKTLRDSDEFCDVADKLADRCLAALAPFLTRATPEEITELLCTHLTTHVPPDLLYITTGEGDGCETETIKRLRRKYCKQKH